MKNSTKVKIGQILFIVLLPLVLICSLFVILVQWGNIASLERYVWYIGGVGLFSAFPLFAAARMMDKNLNFGIQERAIVISRGDKGALSGNVVFETKQNEVIALRVNLIAYDTFSENDVGVLVYKPVPDNLTKFITKIFFRHNKDEQEAHFIKFKSEGKSANPFGAKADKQCKNCGAVIHYDRFSARTACEYCVGNKSAVKKDRKKNPSLSRFGHVLMVVSLLLFVACAFLTVVLLITSSLDQMWLFREIAAVGGLASAFSLVLCVLGGILWRKALPIVKIRAFVAKCGKFKTLSGEIIFETEQEESVTFQLDEVAYKPIFEGEVGVLHYKLDAQNLKFFKKFEREGKSAALSGMADTHCKNCGAAIHIEKYKFVTEVICEHCGQDV